MLLQRSILLEVCLLLAVSLVKAQYSYEKEKKSSPDGAPIFHRPNYEKLFIAEASAPVAAQTANKPEQVRYETPEDYEKIYLPAINEEASNKNEAYESKHEDYPAYLKDFFEGSTKQEGEQSRDEEVVRPGPSYVSHQVPAYPGYENDEDKSASERVSSKDKQSDEDDEEGRVEKDDDDYKLPKFSFEPLNLKNNKQRVDYDTGKSSSTVSQYPEASQYPQAPEYGNTAAAATPYVAYHAYHPAADPYQAQNTRVYDTLVADPYGAASFHGYHPDPENDHVYDTQPSSDVPTKFDENNGCKKVSSEDDTNCFVCENPKTNAKYTQCNYKSKKEPVSYYQGNSAKYSMPHKEESNRYKRYAEKEEEEEETDPYTIVKNRSLKAFEEDLSKDYDKGFQYEPEHYDETKPELTYSEQHAEDIKKNPENCKNVDRKGMTCTVCKDPKTGGNFEQCSYTSTPKEKKYAYVTEKKYDNDEPEETKIVPETKTVELTGESKVNPAAAATEKEDIREYTERIHQEKSPRKRNDESRNEEAREDRRDDERRGDERRGDERRGEERRKEERRDDENSRKEDRDDYEKKPSEKKPVEHEEEDDDTHNYDVPSHFSSIKNAGDYSGSSSDHKSRYPEYDFADFDEYHYKLFPEFAKSESRRQPVKQTYEDKTPVYQVPEEKEVPNYEIPEATKQNVESVLAEFSKKDRSNCKKAEKKGMTCYLCVDKNNIQHEECMYVQESRPQSSHVAYHQVKAVKDKPEGLKPQPVVAESKRKHFFKKVTTPAPVALDAAASEQVGVSVPFQPEESKTQEVNAVEAKAEGSSHKEKRSSDESKEESQEPKAAASDFDDESDRISEKGEPTIHIPKLGTEEGTLTAETRPVYSKVLGIKLPKYMLEKSEFEKEFDEFARSF